MNRRVFLQTLGGGLLGCMGGPLPLKFAWGSEAGAFPILMFHRVDENPHSPEGLTAAQLRKVLDFAWEQGFFPVNMSDILLGRVDAVVPQGLKPLGITVDDAHRSVIFSRSTSVHKDQRNERSFVEVLADSAVRHGFTPRATLFLTSTGGGYFGGQMPLAGILESLNVMPGVEMAYHTRRHPRMRGMGYEQTKAVLEDQMEQFQQLGVLERIVRILAYPYGLQPAPEGLNALRELGFIGGVLAYPGVREGRCKFVPLCQYNGGLLSDPFLLPRVNIGAFIYAPGAITAGARYEPIDPVEDFRKDVLEIPGLYRSRGQEAL